MPFACSSLSRNFKKFRLFEKENEAENARIVSFNTLFFLFEARGPVC